MPILSLFAYGTLQQDQLRGRTWPHPPRSIEVAVVRGELYDLGSYPGILAGSDWVLGELWTLRPHHMDATLKALDAIEDYDSTEHAGLYLRVPITVYPEPANQGLDPIHEDHGVQAYTYFANDPELLSHARRIPAEKPWHGLSVARWPDGLARVPRFIAEE
jgi:gamma-glutamylcyclotransferase (GGCT)/AIG2-like uncharacterized protein YtfP